MTTANPNQGLIAGLTPHLTIPSRGASAAVDFYIIAFGAEVLDRRPADDGERLIHAHLKINGASVMLNDEFPEYSGVQGVRPAGVSLHLQVADPDAWWTRAMTVGGAEPVMDMADQFWGDRYGVLRDPFGHTWSIGGPKPA
ncbi:VOC family protein [Brevundimonas sp. SORGH_AS_0993]|uniref:VOC family protein n=1 Tax=Brevundimonas sp. SORGH_AS_0993 TaxID=3041794 RepID=UPI002783D9D5|nr:VOC family protein [Brevundimonas sp. SORGH_AS_0993]MDQ1153731.1 PhnB protein [Brevundimonas sp. SORGH_AS_0993]